MPLLSPQDTGALLALIRSARDKPLEASLTDFTSTFGSGLRFQALVFAASVLEGSDESRIADRIVGCYLLSRVPTAHSALECPLRALIGQVLLGPRRSLAERTFAVRLLINQQAQLAAVVPSQYAQTFDAATAATQSELQQLQFFLTEPPKPAAASTGQQDRKNGSKGAVHVGSGQNPGADGGAPAAQAAALAMLQALQLGSCPAPYILPPPPLLPPLDGEVRWMQPEIPYELLWDPMPEGRGSRSRQLLEQLQAATREALTPTRQRGLVGALSEDPSLVHRFRLSPPQLLGLVENNPNVAVQVLMQLLSTEQAPSLLHALITMDLSLHSMEVVSRLTHAPDMPPHFLHLFIVHCLSSCTQAKDKGIQNRLVRLVCVFLQNLVGRHLLAIQELLVEIQSFCIEFSRLREAANLFRQLKQLQSDTIDSPIASGLSGDASPAETAKSI